MDSTFKIIDLVVNRPLLITPEKAAAIYDVVTDHSKTRLNPLDGEPIKRDSVGRVVGKPYQLIDGKLAVVSVVGTLVNRGGWIGAQCGVISYEGLEKQIKTAADDDQVEAVIFDFDSPGGEATGCFELAEQIRALTAKKQTVAFVNGMACSAAYALASVAGEIVVTPSASIGSIGVLCMHVDYSRQYDAEGITPTYIFAGKHKVDGNPTEPLNDAARASLQEKVNTFYDDFLATVAKGRGKRFPAAAARKTEAQVFLGKEAVALGLADRLGTFDQVVASLSRTTDRTILKNRQGVTRMEADDSAAAQAVEGVKKDTGKAIAEAKAEGEKIGAKAAYDRLNTIVSAEKVSQDAGRLKAAVDLAIKSQNMSAEDVIAFVTNNVAEAKAQSSASLASRLSVAKDDPLLTAAEVPSEEVGPLTAKARELEKIKSKSFGGSHVGR